MQYRWTLQCANRKTGETTLETFIARDEAAAISEASRSLLLVEKVVDQQPLNAGRAGPETQPGDRQEEFFESAVSTVTKAAPMGGGAELPLDSFVRYGWYLLGVGSVAAVVGVFLAMLDPDVSSLRIVRLGMLLACVGAVCASLGVFALVVLAAAKSICVCLLGESSEK